MSISQVEEDISILVPVAPSEPKEVIQNSVESLTSLEIPENLNILVYYIIDSKNPLNDERVSFLKNQDVKVIVRGEDSGKKAAALNTALNNMSVPDYIVICDVDSRPGENFLLECLEKIKVEDDYFIASSPRKILNKDLNIYTKLVSAEFKFFEDMQRILNNGRGFNLFNGPVAVIKGSFAVENGFDESVMCEDTYFTEEGYIQGYKAVMTDNTIVGEQAVTNFRDLYSQKLRWMMGAIEGIENFTLRMIKSDNPTSVKISWISTMIGPFLALLFSPLSILYIFRLVLGQRSLKQSITIGVAGVFYMWFISLCGLVVIKKRIFAESVNWTQTDRVNI